MKQARLIPVAILLLGAPLAFNPGKVQTPSARALPTLNAGQGDECPGSCGQSECDAQCATDCNGCGRSSCSSGKQDDNCPGGCGQEHCSGRCVAACSLCGRSSCSGCVGGCGRSGDDCKALCNGECTDGCDYAGCREDASAGFKCRNGFRKNHAASAAPNRGCGCGKPSRNPLRRWQG